MKFYRIRHRISGMYFCPTRHISKKGCGYVKSNLSKNGKVYTSKPNPYWFEEYHHPDDQSRGSNIVRISRDDEWIIEEYEGDAK